MEGAGRGLTSTSSMSQTLYAVIALALAVLLTLTVTRARMGDSQQVMQQQTTVYATDAGLELLDHIRSRPFDAATRAAPADELVDRSALTAMPFASGGTYAAAGDVDDFHRMAPHTVDVAGTPFRATAAVRYVQEDQLTTASATPTYAKEVTVFVWGDAMPDTLALTQVVTYP